MMIGRCTALVLAHSPYGEPNIGVGYWVCAIWDQLLYRQLPRY